MLSTSSPQRRILPRIAVGGILHETNTFAPGVTTLDAFHDRVYLEGDDIVTAGAGSDSALGGVLDTARGRASIVPTVFASAMPGPPVADAAFDTLASRLLSRLRQANRGYPRIAGVVLLLHGAMVTESEPDPEGSLLADVRSLVGPRCPVVVVIDSHATLTARMVESVDMILAYRTYPHLDTRDRGIEAMETCLALAAGVPRPYAGFRKLPLLMPLLAQVTEPGSPFEPVVSRAAGWRKRPGIRAVSLVPGFPFADVPGAGSSVVTYAESQVLADSASEDLATAWWDRRESFRVVGRPPEALLDLETAGTVVVADIADNPGAGADGGSPYLLRFFIEHRLEPTAFAGIVDPASVARCHEAGVGAHVALVIGSNHREPISGEWRVDHLGNGVYVNRGPMANGAVNRIGRTATVRHGAISVILCERRGQVVDPAVFEACGVAPDGCRWLVIKSSVHFRAAFRSVANEMIEIEGQGLGTSVLTDLAYNRVCRPIWPLDDADVDGASVVGERGARG